MSSPTFASDFRIIQRFPVLRGARATASKASVLGEPDAVAAPDTTPIESKRHPPDFQRNVVSGGIMPHASVSTAVHRIRSPSRQSFDGMPEQLVYGLFESHKNVRYVIPKSWSPTNSRQAKTAIQLQNGTLAPTPYSELDHYRREEKERSIRARLHGSFRFKDEGRSWPHDSLSSLNDDWVWQALSTRQRTKLLYDDVARSSSIRARKRSK